jgi:hypothetical protein
MQRIGFIAFPNFQVLSLCTISVFECANMLAREPLYDLHIISETGGRIQTSCGLSLETEMFDETTFDTLIVLGALVDKPTFSPKFSRSLPGCGRRPHQREGAGSDYDKRRRKRCALSQGKQRVLSLRGSQLGFRPGLAPHGARFNLAQDTQRNDPWPRNGLESGECRLKRYPSVQIRYLLLNETCCTKEIPNDAICRRPAHN